MVEDLGNGFYKGKWLVYQDVGRVNKNAKTHKYEVRLKREGTIVGYIRYFTLWRSFCFYSTNGVLDTYSLREVSDFCETKQNELKALVAAKMPKKRGRYNTSGQKDLWGFDTKNPKVIKVTAGPIELRSSSTAERDTVNVDDEGSTPSSAAI